MSMTPHERLAYCYDAAIQAQIGATDLLRHGVHPMVVLRGTLNIYDSLIDRSIDDIQWDDYLHGMDTIAKCMCIKFADGIIADLASKHTHQQLRDEWNGSKPTTRIV
jgi:hypothetical protein